MANRFFRNTGNTGWATGSNWSATDGGGSVGAAPVAGDAVFFTSNSGNCSSTAGAACGSIDCTGYSGTLTINNAITLSITANNVTLSPTMTITGSSGLVFNSVGTNNPHTLTANGKTFGLNLTLNGSSSPQFVFADTWTVNTLILGGGTKNLGGGNTINVNGNLTVNIGTSGTANIVLTGTGSWSGSASLSNNLTINTSGTITIGSSVSYQTGTLTYVAGTVDTTTNSSTLTLANDCTLNTNGINWNDVLSSAAVTLTINSLFTVNGTLTLSSNNKTFAGTAGFNVATLVDSSTSSNNRNLSASNTYRIRTQWTATSSNPANHLQYKSSTGGTKTTLTLDFGAICTLGYVDFTDVDASSGRRINTFNGSLSNTLNIATYTDPYATQAKSFIV